MLFSKKLLTITILSILIVFSILPVFAETPAAAEPPFDCWPKDLCSKQKGNWAQTERSKKQCGAFEKNIGALGFCYAPPPQVNLQVAIGEKSVIAGLTDYIPNVYNYLVGIVSLVSIIMIMVGGLKYLTAGGSPERVNSAKETILGAIIGLFLTFGSYILLQTINPALTQLKLPDIKKIRTIALTKEGPCASGRGEISLGQKCNNSCECKQGACIPMEKGSLEKFVEGVGYGIGIAGSVMMVGGGSIAQGGKTIIIAIKEGAKQLPKLAKFIYKHPLASGAAGYTLYSFTGGDAGQPGICIVEANRNVLAGAWCEKNEHCVSGKCIGLDLNLGGMAGGKGIGVCADGKVGSACECTQTGVCAETGGCIAGLSCVDNSDGKYTKSCTDGKTGSPCYNNTGCKVSGDKCKSPGSFKPKQCLHDTGAIDIGTACTTDAQCGYTGKVGDWRCVNGFCSNGGDGTNCNIPNSVCQKGFTCAFWFDDAGKWIVDTGNEQDYKKNNELWGQWLVVKKSPNQNIICINDNATDLASPN